MLDQGIRPTAISFISFLNVFANARRPDLAAQHLDSMASHGLTPTVTHWNTILKACQKAAAAPEALRQFARMRATGLAPNIVSYTCILAALSELEQEQREAELRSLLADLAAAGVARDTHFCEMCAAAR